MGLPRLNGITLVASILFFFGEAVLLFFTPRTETLQLFTLFFALFAAYIAMIPELRHVRTAAFMGVLFRCLAWLSFPSLSDDIYRFMWDGAVILDGYNPYMETPTSFLAHHLEPPFEMLCPKLNSPGHYSIYPLVVQVCAAFGALAGNDPYLASLIIKLPILIAEIGTIWILPRILMQLRISPRLSFLYFLNPLVIVELCGNGHFEGVMIFFILWSVKLGLGKRYHWSGVALAMAVGTKLLPLLLFPFLLKAVPLNRKLHYFLGFAITCAVLFIPLYNATIFAHFSETFRFYLTGLEFNASIYYFLQQAIHWLAGPEPGIIVGPVLSLITLAVLVYLWFRQQPVLADALRTGLMALLVYFILSTTVYPWYITTLVALGVFSGRQYVIVWSALVFISYSAYGVADQYEENSFLILLEYLLLALVYFYPRAIVRLLPSIR